MGSSGGGGDFFTSMASLFSGGMDTTKQQTELAKADAKVQRDKADKTQKDLKDAARSQAAAIALKNRAMVLGSDRGGYASGGTVLTSPSPTALGSVGGKTTVGG